MKIQRSSGILLHITSLPSLFGIGDLGPAAYSFADFLHETKQRYWQILPLNPIRESRGNSPYSSTSAFAGNVLLISPELLAMEGLLDDRDLQEIPKFKAGKTQFKKARKFKIALLKKAFKNYNKESFPSLHSKYDKFKDEHSFWLSDFALFEVLFLHFKETSWINWPPELKNRDAKALEEISKVLAEKLEQVMFFQFLFFWQWDKLKAYCRLKGISFIGDVPFYVDHDSAELWSRPELFKLNSNKEPYVVSGVPPDYYSETGQLWGTPVYDWDAAEETKFEWWKTRIGHNLYLTDIVRLDHFRAFSEYWEVPAEHKTAIHGSYKKTPGWEFFNLIRQKYPDMPFIAEDLGDIDQKVYDLKDHFELPGMKLLLFAFGDNMAKNPYIPHNHIHNSVIYTGTHDNNTVKGWYTEEATAQIKKQIKDYTGRNIHKSDIHDVLIRMAMSSVANLTVLPIQDVLGLGSSAKMNIPSTSDHNWEWRLKEGMLHDEVKKYLKDMTETYGRG